MIVVVMGVSGSGKTTVGRLLARRWGCPFSDADAFHPVANVAKMSRGVALDDADRGPWLRAVRAAIVAARRAGEDHVFACSALADAHRRVLAQEGEADVVFVHLAGDIALIGERLAARRGHFFDPALLRDQFARLESPAGAVVVDIRRPAEEIAEALARRLRDPAADRHPSNREDRET